jgi:ribonuclease-3
VSLADIPESLRALPDAEFAGSSEFAELARLQQAIGYSFARPTLLRVALTHPSWTGERPRNAWPNQAVLEFFGDAVLDLCAAQAVWMRFSTVSEGVLTALRIVLVSEAALASVANEIDLGQWLFLGKGARAHGGRRHHAMLADTIEAILGAVFLDARGADQDPMRAAENVFLRLFGARIDSLAIEDASEPKSELQNLVQDKVRRTPRYACEALSAGHFLAVVQVDIGESAVLELGKGEGPSHKAAEREAARAALRSIREGLISLADLPGETTS